MIFRVARLLPRQIRSPPRTRNLGPSALRTQEDSSNLEDVLHTLVMFLDLLVISFRKRAFCMYDGQVMHTLPGSAPLLRPLLPLSTVPQPAKAGILQPGFALGP